MTLEEILALVAGRESETLEFKRTTGTRREAAATVCALLNHRGGHMLFGVTPEGDVLTRISHTVTAEGYWGSVGAEFLPREQVEREQAALRPCFRGARVAGTAA